MRTKFESKHVKLHRQQHDLWLSVPQKLRSLCQVTVCWCLTSEEQVLAVCICLGRCVAESLYRIIGLVTLHIRSHTGEEPCVCKICERRFSPGSRSNTEELTEVRSHILTLVSLMCSSCQLQRFLSAVIYILMYLVSAST